MQPQTDEQRGRRACALTARGATSKAMKGLMDAGSSRMSEDVDCSLDSTELVLAAVHTPRLWNPVKQLEQLGEEAGARQLAVLCENEGAEKQEWRRSHM